VLDSDRQFVNAATSSVKHGVGDGCGSTDLPNLSAALDTERIDDLVVDLIEVHFDFEYIRFHRDRVVTQAGIRPGPVG
jgi:hypothetical protein